PDTREQSGQPVMTREEDNGISVALDPQTLSSGFCVSTEWEVVFLGSTSLAEVILVKGHGLYLKKLGLVFLGFLEGFDWGFVGRVLSSLEEG
ncbi:hypothetical protein Tco_0917985, partial [Tanacetum coccineum]